MILGLVLGSMPEFQEDLTNVSAYHLLHSNRRRYDNPEDDELLTTLQKQYPDFVYKPTDRPVAHLLVVEYICMAWFTIEYFLRFLISLNKLEFIRQPLNVIDLLTIVPFYLELCLPFLGINADKLKELSGAMMVIRIIRVLRMTRMFKLARYSTTLQTFGHTFRSSITELSMLIMFLVTGILFFSTILYFLEKDEINSQFKSIPAACWWCVVTMTTIGYGDSVPHTAGGKLLATLASICGIIALAFPISMIVEKFATAQQKILQLQPLNKVRIPTVDNEDLQRDWIDSVHRKLAVT
ncbi:hypothetical protein AB6A40_008473 [Gnathostoma spinigerum]|uniref:Ion transport domain-containing protein n=1 Tax=Gnathostoma spinigerum TaxID=75299 RepID=A0ABD6EP62_9BILA